MPLRIGIVDTGVNPWHSHVRGRVTGCRIRLGEDGRIEEVPVFHDPLGHGTAVAGVIREGLPEAELFAVGVFEKSKDTYPSLVARGILTAAGAGCDLVNLSLTVPPGPGEELLKDACAAAIDAGCALVASAPADRPGWLPAALPGVWAVAVDDTLEFGHVREDGPQRLAAPGCPRDLAFLPREANFWGPSFACARGLVYLARKRGPSL